MKRFSKLRDLSEDHHRGLVLARKALQAASGSKGLHVSQVWNEVEEKFASELEPHFEIEEKYIGVPLRNEGATEIVDRLHAEHKELRECIRFEVARTSVNLGRFGKLLEKHIRFEERELFEVAQEILDSRALNAVEEACRRRVVKR
ncbi:MAG: hemerythrin domain-containing protein [Candidatus Marinimicrobia bacterium]|nr:hemerythrin domain-containing protein [Candidatus Neomarinimicrobiota bacterium]